MTDLRRIAALWRDGCNTAEIAKAMGIPESDVWNRMSHVMATYPWAKRGTAVFHVKTRRA